MLFYKSLQKEQEKNDAVVLFEIKYIASKQVSF